MYVGVIARHAGVEQLKDASVFKFSSPEGWPTLFLDLRDPTVVAAQDAALAAFMAQLAAEFILDADGNPIARRARRYRYVLPCDTARVCFLKSLYFGCFSCNIFG